jgi:TRAP-type C4-dicarboxylate transport system substrate-binding protein
MERPFQHKQKEGLMTKLAAKMCGIVFFISCCFLGFSSHAAEKVITLRFAHYLPANGVEGRSMQDWANEVEKRTSGRVKVTMYPGGTIMGMDQMYDGVTKEVADIGYGIFAYHRGRFPLTEVIDLPLGYKNFDTVTKLVNAYHRKFKPKEMDDVKVLYLEGYGPGILHLRKPVNKLEDLKGMKIRGHGVSGRIVTALGGAPVGIPITDTYDALSKGIVEGALFGWGGAYTFNIGDITKYHLVSSGVAYGTAFYTVMNKDKWNSLPKDIQTIIDKLDEEWIDRLAKKWLEFDTAGKAGLEKKGNKVITLSQQENARWAERVKPILDDYVKASKAKGLPGEEALKFCQEFLKANDK